MSEERNNEFDIEDIVIEDVDIQEIEDRNRTFFREDEDFDEKTDHQTTEDEHWKSGEESAEGAKEAGPGVQEEPQAADRDLQEESQAVKKRPAEKSEAAEGQPAEKPEAAEGQHTEEPETADKKGAPGPSPEISAVSDRSYVRNLRTIGEEDDEDEDDDEIYEDKPRRKKSKLNLVRYFIMFIALCVLVYSVFSLASILMEYKAGEDQYEEIQNIAQTDSDEEQQQEFMDEEEPLNPNFQVPNINWEELYAINPDIYAWIQFETLGQINYPVVHSSDNDYYLHHTVNHTENSAGSIFIEAQNRTDFSDMNTFVYGHNMKNGSMFGLLRYYKEASYYQGNEYFWIYTPQGNYRYKIFSCYEPRAESETYTWWSDPCDEYTQYLEKVKSYSKYDTGVTVKPTDRIVTLSTCTSRGSDYRFVVHGKLVYSSVSRPENSAQQ